MAIETGIASNSLPASVEAREARETASANCANRWDLRGAVRG